MSRESTSVRIHMSVFMLAVLVAVCACGEALGQPFPSKPLRMLVAGGAGGSIDYIGRLVGQKVAASIGQPVVIDNRGGGGGNLGAEVVAKAGADGHTILAIGASIAINPSLYPRLNYDPARDFVPLTQATAAGYVMVVHPAMPARGVKEFIALAKSRKDGITYASPGSGQAQHLGMELLKTLTGIAAVHVPYKGGSPAVIGVAGGQTDVLLSSAPAALPALQAGRLKALAVTSLKRMASLPEVPTLAESGFPGYEVSGWIGFFAPAATPREIVARWHEELVRGLEAADVRESLRASGQDIVASNPERFGAYFRAELAKWREVVKRSGATAD